MTWAVLEGDCVELMADMEPTGPTFENEKDARAFLDWLPLDAHTYKGNGLKIMYLRWLDRDTE